MKFSKKDVRKLKSATKEELGKLQKEYEALMKDVQGMSPVGLLAIAVAGIAVILFFKNNVFDFIGLAMILYPLYLFIQRGAHREGYFEGYYDMMTKLGSQAEHTKPEKPDKE